MQERSPSSLEEFQFKAINFHGSPIFLVEKYFEMSNNLKALNPSQDII